MQSRLSSRMIQLNLLLSVVPRFHHYQVKEEMLQKKNVSVSQTTSL